uniref:Uncharacterized protein n=1 Tax=Eutreptiella gymnastica TaxID=73025 RepID=A0A7S4CKW8_9EUGL
MWMSQGKVCKCAKIVCNSEMRITGQRHNVPMCHRMCSAPSTCGTFITTATAHWHCSQMHKIHPSYLYTPVSGGMPATDTQQGPPTRISQAAMGHMYTEETANPLASSKRLDFFPATNDHILTIKHQTLR